jgi:hypothetical protein
MTRTTPGFRSTNVFFDCDWNDDRRRLALYKGDVFVFPRAPAAHALVDLARELLNGAFAPYPPSEAQHHLAVEDYAAALGTVKPAFIHHPDCKRLIPELLEQLGADPECVHFDLPRMRSATAHDYLTSGIAFAFHPHRDTWYSAPQAQINWWFPIYEIEPDNAMALYPECCARRLPNSSETYNYYHWNLESRGAATQQIGTDIRTQPKLTEDVELGSELRTITPVGGVFAFSGQQLHATAPNTTDVTRFSIDFRTVHRGDLEEGLGAPSVDARCTGTSLRDFLNAADLSPLSDQLIERYDDDSALQYAESLIYQPPGVVA